MAPASDQNNDGASSPEQHAETTTLTESDDLTVVSQLEFGSTRTYRVQESPDQPAFVHCDSTDSFGGDDALRDPAQVNQSLNLNLGQTIISPENTTLLWILRFLNSILISWWEKYAFRAWNQIPVAWRRALCRIAWKLYLPLHKALLGRSTGIHRDASLEYHAMTTVMWWGRFFPVSVERMRFSLSQLNIWCREPLMAPHVTAICDDSTLQHVDTKLIPERQRDFGTVKGLFLHRHSPEQPTEWTILWVYGGAFLSGDAPGNATKADMVSRQTGMDVFLCEYRLVPEYQADDIHWDVGLAYQWLCQHKQKQQGNPQKILLLGISSGAAACVRICQYIAEKNRGETLVPSYMNVAIPSQMPAGAVLLGPFVDFTEPKGSFVHYPKHDLIVNPRVVETGAPYLDTHLPDRRGYSPCYRNCHDLPPLCVVVSEHEAVFDMTVALINRARADGVHVTVGCWKYMCHVFSFLDAFIPEGKQSVDFACAWMRWKSGNDTKLLENNDEKKTSPGKRRQNNKLNNAWLMVSLLMFLSMMVADGWAFSTSERRIRSAQSISLYAKRPLSTSEQERRDEDRRRLERKDDVVIGQTSAKRDAQDFALDVKATEQAYLSQASNVDQAIFQYTEQGMQHLKLLRLHEAKEAFDQVFRLKPEAYLWQAGIVLYYLQDFQQAAHVLVQAVTFFESRFGQPATEERIWRSAAQLRLISSITSKSERLRLAQTLDDNPQEIIPQIPPRAVFFEEDQTEEQFLATEMRKVLRIARELFDASIQKDSVTVILSRAKLRAITGPYMDWNDVTDANKKSPERFVLDRKMWKLSAWFYLGLHYDALGIEEEAKRCMTMALAQCPTSAAAADIVHTLPLLHMSQREWFEDEDDFLQDEEDTTTENEKKDPRREAKAKEAEKLTAPSTSSINNATPELSNISPIVLSTIQEGIWGLTVVELRRALQVKGLKPGVAPKEELRKKLFDSLLEDAGLIG